MQSFHAIAEERIHCDTTLEVFPRMRFRGNVKRVSDVVEVVRQLLDPSRSKYHFLAQVFGRASPTSEWQKLALDACISQYPSGTYRLVFKPFVADAQFLRAREEIDGTLHDLREQRWTPRLNFSLPDGSNFLGAVLGGKHVVDKTACLQDILQRKWTYLLRPRRFGKTSWVSMLKYFFVGSVELFSKFAVGQQRIAENTVIQEAGNFAWDPANVGGTPHRFPPIPIIRLDFSNYTQYATAAEANNALLATLNKIAAHEGLEPVTTLHDLITGLAEHPCNEWKKVVVLIDEYDAVLNARANDEVVFADLREYFIKSFYEGLKACDEHILYCFVTGNSAYGKASLWSTVNHMSDRSLDRELATTFGFTHNETLEVLQRAQIQMDDATWEELKKRNDGYRFTTDVSVETVFSPFLVAAVVNAGRLVSGVWTSTASEAVFKRVSRSNIPELPYKISKANLEAKAVPPLGCSTEVAKMLFRAGYVTIVEAVGEDIVLDVVNEEAFAALAQSYLLLRFAEEPDLLAQLRELLIAGDFVGFFQKVNDEVFHQTPEKATLGLSHKERYYEAMLFTCMELSIRGTRCTVTREQAIAAGYADIIFTKPPALHAVIEIKKVETELIWKTSHPQDENPLDAADASTGKLQANLLRVYQRAAEVAHDQIIRKGHAAAPGYAGEHKLMIGLVVDAYRRELAFVHFRCKGATVNTAVLLSNWDQLSEAVNGQALFQELENDESGESIDLHDFDDL